MHILHREDCLAELLEGLKMSCPCGLSVNPWNLVSVVQVCTDSLLAIITMYVKVYEW